MSRKYSQTLRPDIMVLLLATLLILAGNGLLETSVSYRTSLLSQSSLQTGITMACYYGGFLLGSWHGPVVLRYLTHRQSFAVLLCIFACLIAMLGLVHQAYSVAVLQLFCGLLISGIYVVVESYINSRACPHSRNRYFSYYMSVWYIGVGCGQLPLLANSGFHSYFFGIAALLACSAFIPCFFWRPRPAYQANPIPKDKPVAAAGDKFIHLLRRGPRPYLISVISGAMIGILLGMGPAFGEQFFSSSHTTSMMISTYVFGALLMQLILSRLPLLFNNEKCLVFMAMIGVLAVVSSTGLIRNGPTEYLALLLPSLLLGASCLPVYSLSAALAQAQVEDGSRITASALLLLCNGVGSIVGPLVAGYTMQHWGYYCFYASLLACHIVLLSLARARWYSFRKRKPRTEMCLK